MDQTLCIKYFRVNQIPKKKLTPKKLKIKEIFAFKVASSISYNSSVLQYKGLHTVIYIKYTIFKTKLKRKAYEIIY